MVVGGRMEEKIGSGVEDGMCGWRSGSSVWVGEGRLVCGEGRVKEESIRQKKWRRGEGWGLGLDGREGEGRGGERSR